MTHLNCMGTHFTQSEQWTTECGKEFQKLKEEQAPHFYFMFHSLFISPHLLVHICSRTPFGKRTLFLRCVRVLM